MCGCPLVIHVFQETGEICRVPKKKCNKHYCWEKLRRAEIDLERVRQVLFVDDNFFAQRLTDLDLLSTFYDLYNM